MANATIEGRNCTLFYDYDYHQNCSLRALTDDGKIEWLERRMNMIFLDPLIRITDRNSNIFKALEHPEAGPPMTPMLMVVSLLMNGMEALGSFLVTIGSTKHDCFHAFINKYMHTWTQQVDTPHHGRMRLSQILWKNYRNGLAHSFAILDAGIESLPNANRFAISNGAFQIDGWKLFDDLQFGINQMFRDVRTDVDMKRVFLARFRDVYRC